MTKINLKFILLSIFLSISLTAFADDSNCGMLDDGKTVDGLNTQICAENFKAQIKDSIFGEASFAFRGSMNGEERQKVLDLKTPQQIEQDDRNKRTVGIGNEYLLKIVQFIMYTFMVISFFSGMWFAMKGDFNTSHQDEDDDEGPNEAKRNKLLSLIIALSIYCLNWPFIFGVTIIQFLLLGFLNIGGRATEFITGNFLSHIANTDLEYTKTGESSTDVQFQNGQAMSRAEAISTAVTQRVVQLMMTSQAYNSTLNPLKVNFQLYDDFADIIKDEGNKWSFMKMNPEMLDQKLYNLGGFQFYNTPNAGAKTEEYLSVISYADTYKVHNDVAKIDSDAESIKKDLKIATQEKGAEAGTYQSIVDSAMLAYFYDVRTNITAKTVKEFLLSDDAKKLGFAILNAACSDRPGLRQTSAEYIKSGKYLPICVNEDWTIAGEGKKEDYEKTMTTITDNLKNKIFNDLIKINTSYHNSLDTPERAETIKRIRQQGDLAVYLQLGEVIRDLLFNASAQNNFNNKPFYSIFNPATGDSYIEDEWLKNQKKFEDSAYPLQIGEYLSIYFKAISATSIGIPVQDAQTSLQNELASNSAKTVQLDNFERANSLAMENIGLTLQRNNASSQMPLVGLADIGMQMIQTGQNGIFTIVVASVVGSGIDKIITAKRAVNTKEVAGVGKKVDNKRSKGKFTFFTALFKYASETIIPAMATLIGFGALFAYLLPLLMKLPFFLIAVLFLFYSVMIVIFSIFSAIHAPKWHTWHSLLEFIGNIWRIGVVFVIFQPLNMIAFIINWFLVGHMLKMVYSVMAFSYVDTVSQTTGLFGTTLITIGMLAVAMWITTVSVIYTTLSMLTQFLSLYRQELIFANIIIDSINKFMVVLNVFSLGFTKLIQPAASSIMKSLNLNRAKG